VQTKQSKSRALERECRSPALVLAASTRLLTRHVNIDNLAPLRHHRGNVTLGELVRQPADVDVGGVGVGGVP